MPFVSDVWKLIYAKKRKDKRHQNKKNSQMSVPFAASDWNDCTLSKHIYKYTCTDPRVEFCSAVGVVN